MIDPLHKWCLNVNNYTYTSLASHSCEKSFVWKHDYEAKDVWSIVIEIYGPFMQRSIGQMAGAPNDCFSQMLLNAVLGYLEYFKALKVNFRLR